MNERKLAAVVMAAGLGKRMRSETPKHLHPLLGRRLVDWVIETALALGAKPLVVVTSPQTEDTIAHVGVTVAVQLEARGTGDAIAAARTALAGFDGDVLVLSGDSPLLTPDISTQAMVTRLPWRAASARIASASARTS